MTLAFQDLSNACLVVAHPDDEVLWFSSILDRVGRIIVCFEECADLPELGPGRRRVREAYPLPNVDWLQAPEPCSVHQVDWARPSFGPHGLDLNALGTSVERVERYADSYQSLRQKLAVRLGDTSLVLTHNPWGEYGHPDHSQVARVVESLKDALGYRVVYSGYVASRTMPLAAETLPRLGQAFRLATNPKLVEPIEALYRNHGCWTWPVDYQRFDTESFLEDTGQAPQPGWGFGLNCITA